MPEWLQRFLRHRARALRELLAEMPAISCGHCVEVACFSVESSAAVTHWSRLHVGSCLFTSGLEGVRYPDTSFCFRTVRPFSRPLKSQHRTNIGQDTRAGKDQGRTQQPRTYRIHTHTRNMGRKQASAGSRGASFGFLALCLFAKYSQLLQLASLSQPHLRDSWWVSRWVSGDGQCRDRPKEMPDS